MRRVVSWDFLKIEFRDIYDSIIDMEKQCNSKDTIDKFNVFLKNIVVRICEVTNTIYIGNRITSLDEIRRFGKIVNMPIEIIDILTYVYDEIRDDEVKNAIVELYEVCVWLAITYGEEKYTLLYESLDDYERDIFNKYLMLDDFDTLLETQLEEDDDIILLEDEEEEYEEEVEDSKEEDLVREAQEYYLGIGKDKNYEAAFIRFKKAANLGNSYGAAYVGVFYDRGYGVKENKKLAYIWYKKAALKGNPFAQYILGYNYLIGNGVDRNIQTAIYWLEKSCEYEYAPAQYELAKLYYTALGVNQDFSKAFELYTKSAEDGYSPAQYALAYMYKNGKGCDKNIISSYYWLEKSAQNNYEDSYYLMGEYYLKGLYVDENYEKAYYYLNLSSEVGNGKAQELLGDMYYYGYHVTKDENRAIQLYLESARNGNVEIYNKLGTYYKKKNDIPKAIFYYKKGCLYDSPWCAEELGSIYLAGNGTKEDIGKALKYFKLASKKELEYSIAMVGYIYYKYNEEFNEDYNPWLLQAYSKGSSNAAYFLSKDLLVKYYKGEDVDFDKLYEYTNFAAEKGIPGAIYHLGVIYEDGIGVDKDLLKGYLNYEKAALKGDGKAYIKMANSFQHGTYYSRNISLAIKSLEKISDEYIDDAIIQLINIYENGIGGELDYSKTNYYAGELLKYNKVEALKRLIKYNVLGIGVEVNKEKGQELLNELAEIDKGEYNLIVGNIQKLNGKNPIELYCKAIENGNKEAMGELSLYIIENNIYEITSEVKENIRCGIDLAVGKSLLAQGIAVLKKNNYSGENRECEIAITNIRKLVYKGLYEGLIYIYKYYLNQKQNKDTLDKLLKLEIDMDYYNIDYNDEAVEIITPNKWLYILMIIIILGVLIYTVV